MLYSKGRRCRLGLKSALPLALPLLASVSSTADKNLSEDPVEAFVAQQRRKATQAYETLYGDGFGLDGEPAPARDVFEERYIVTALERETKEILKAKGYSQPEKERSPLDVDKKDSPTSLDAEIDQLAVQKKQRRVIRERVRSAKQQELLAESPAPGDTLFWEVPCAESLYRRHMYETVPGCTPSVKMGPPCGRLVADGIVSEAESASLRAVMDSAFEGLYHRGSETLLVPELSTRSRLGETGFQLTSDLLERVRVNVAKTLNISQLYYSGSLMKRMDYPPLGGNMQLAPDHDAWNPHVDKVNIASYDWSALLYLNDAGTDFGGGELQFHDEDADRVVRPQTGRLAAFSSGLENLHRVAPMTWGSRYVLSMWFTCSKDHSHTELAPQVGAGAQDVPRRHEL